LDGPDNSSFLYASKTGNRNGTNESLQEKFSEQFHYNTCHMQVDNNVPREEGEDDRAQMETLQFFPMQCLIV
jgi:hypothetical protein